MKQYEKRLDYCLKCSTCHTQCPVLENFLDFPGPKHLGPELERLRMAQGHKIQLTIDGKLAYCTNCKRCDLACPHGVKPSVFNMHNRARIGLPLQEKVRDWVLAHNGWWGGIASHMPALSNLALHNPLTRIFLDAIGLAPRDLPSYDKRKLKIGKHFSSQKKAVYFLGCYARYNEVAIAQSVINIFEALGYQLEIAPLGCCGTPLFSNGFLNEARELAEKNSRVLLDYIEKGYKVISSCPSCTLTLKEEYRDLFALPVGEKLARGVYDVCELLVEEEVSLKGATDPYGSAYYHVPCHLKAQGMGTPAAELLGQGVVQELTVSDGYCCGMAGTYGFKKEKYELSKAIGSPVFQGIMDKDYQLVLTDCGTCKLQIEQNTGRKVLHPVQVMEKLIVGT
jgi:glycerol-3-phosphate dehydrogenase subunit C